MGYRHRLMPAACCLAALIVPLPLSAHGPSGKHQDMSAAHDEAAMKAQHDRMDRFREAMQGLQEAIILDDVKKAREDAEALSRALEGHEKDVPHKNRSRMKEFHGLYAEMGKRTNTLRAALSAGRLPKAGVAFGKVLETCASCHRKFRD